MHILSAEQVKEWDQYTIRHEPVASIDLMERAAKKCFEWINSHSWQTRHFRIFCGKGNNGGDGLAIARMLLHEGYDVSLYILEPGNKGTDDFQINLQRLHDMLFTDIHFIQSDDAFPDIANHDIVIDALFGSGLNKPLHSLSAQLVLHINQSKAAVISVDLPSGLFIDIASAKNTVINATHTLTFQSYKLALLVQENAAFVGQVTVLDIGLHPGFIKEIKKIAHQLITGEVVKKIYRPRNSFSHKGAFGHAFIAGGSRGKMGAVVLAAKACVRTGAGLTTAFVPACGVDIMQTSVPEAMVVTNGAESFLSHLPGELGKYNVIGAGPGMGTEQATGELMSKLIMESEKRFVIDADGLNLLSMRSELIRQLPPYAVLTPHPKEFDRLFGRQENDFERLKTATDKAKELKVIIVLKGHHTLIATPRGSYFNTTGNAGMAKGGSGDVLTGIITALSAQGYSAEEAAVMGVYLHGCAGDLAANVLSEEAMTATDIINFLPESFLKLSRR